MRAYAGLRRVDGGGPGGRAPSDPVCSGGRGGGTAHLAAATGDDGGDGDGAAAAAAASWAHVRTFLPPTVD